MTEEEKKAIRERISRIVENEKYKMEPFDDDIMIEVGTFTCVCVNYGIELIGEAFGMEVEEIAHDDDKYKQLIIDGVRIHQWVKFGKYRLENGEWRSDDEI